MLDFYDSVTTVLEGASRTIGLEVGNLLPLVQLLASPGTNFFHPRKSATVFALAAGIHTAADLNNRFVSHVLVIGT